MTVKYQRQKLKAARDWEEARPTRKKKRARQRAEKDLLLAINKAKGRKGGLYRRKKT